MNGKSEVNLESLRKLGIEVRDLGGHPYVDEVDLMRVLRPMNRWNDYLSAVNWADRTVLGPSPESAEAALRKLNL